MFCINDVDMEEQVHQQIIRGCTASLANLVVADQLAQTSNSGVLRAFLKTGSLLSTICEQINIQRRMSNCALTLQVRQH